MASEIHEDLCTFVTIDHEKGDSHINDFILPGVKLRRQAPRPTLRSYIVLIVPVIRCTRRVNMLRGRNNISIEGVSGSWMLIWIIYFLLYYSGYLAHGLRAD